VARERLILVDGSSLIYRAYYAIPSNFTTTAGLHTNAIYGFATMFRKMLAGRRPEYAAVVFDAPGKTFRDEKYPDYKAQRPRMDPELREQLEHIDAIVDAHAWTRLRVPGYEADDVIGTLVKRAQAAGVEVFIVSGDKDFAQLISEDVRMVDTLRDVTYDPELVRKKWGVAPEHFVDLLSMMGDKSDNIPGVPGIGQKGAAKLIDAYGHLEEILANVAQLKGRQKKNLTDFADQARLSHALATIETRVPLEAVPEDQGLEPLRVGPPDAAKLNAVYRTYEFYSLLSEEAAPEGEEQGAAGDYAAIEQASLPAFVTLLEQADTVSVFPCFDEETPVMGKLAGLAFSWGDGQGRYVSVEGDGGLGDAGMEALRSWFEDPERTKQTYNAKHLRILLQRRSPAIELRGVTHDVLLESFLVEPTKVIPHELAQIAKEYLHRAIAPRKRVTGSGKQEKRLSECPRDEVVAWAARRAELVHSLAPLLRERLEAAGLLDHFTRVDLPLAWTLSRMELAGIAVDPDDLASMGDEFRARLEQRRAQVHRLAGREFNIQSTKQLSKVLFEELELPVIKRTKSGYSTNAEVLTRLAPKHPIASEVLEFRKLAKLINTYTEVLQDAVNPATGRIHASFQQTVGATGRLITTNPDLQRTPVKTPEGARIRQAFVAPDGFQLICADWSQIELRLLAHFTEDANLVEAFTKGRDVHARTAGELFGVAPGAVTKPQRDVGKLVNFATIYGQGATALGQILGEKRSVAQRYIDDYFAAYSGVRAWLDSTMEQAHEDGFVTTIAGRRRYIPELSSNSYMDRQAGERIAANTPIQGSAADLCKQAMLDIDAELSAKSMRTRMVLQIHDELVLEAPADEVEEACAIVRDTMEHAAALSVPLVVDLGVGRTWRDAKR
jgi:DNA polymerase-1